MTDKRSRSKTAAEAVSNVSPTALRHPKRWPICMTERRLATTPPLEGLLEDC